jgi:hypothetical protein
MVVKYDVGGELGLTETTTMPSTTGIGAFGIILIVVVVIGLLWFVGR